MGIHEGAGAAGAITDMTFYSASWAALLLYRAIRKAYWTQHEKQRDDSPVHGNDLKSFPTALCLFRTDAVTIYVQFEQITA